MHILHIHIIFLLFITYILFIYITANVSYENIIKELVRNAYYLLLLIIASNSIVKFDKIYLLAKILLIFNFTVQLFQYFKIFNINKYIMMIYGSDYRIFLSSTYYSEFTSFRSGSIYGNSNIYSKIAVTVLIIFLQNRIINHKKIDYIYILISILSIFICGSRIGSILLFIIFIVFFSVIFKKVYKKVFSIFVTIIISFAFILFFNIRSAKIISIFTSPHFPLGYKLNLINNYLNSTNFFHLLFGSSPALETMFDSEIGYVYGWYGLIGLLLFAFIIISILKKGRNTSNNFFYISFGLILLFNSISGGLLLNIKLFPFIGSIIYVNKFDNEL